jgi:predicted ATPase
VQLFAARIAQLDSGFSTGPDNLPAIAGICSHLDGIPLAIEFAAARVATLGLHEVAARLDDRFAVLTSGRRTALPRHQTLRAALDWSYELLTKPEQSLLSRLAIFVGGFTLEAAAAVMSGAEGAAAAVANGIASLATKSLVALEHSVGGRYRLLETIRAYALGKLDESGEAQQVARRHAEFFAETAPSAREIDNVRAALDWAFSPGADGATGVVLTAAYGSVWLQMSLIAECRERTE